MLARSMRWGLVFAVVVSLLATPAFAEEAQAPVQADDRFGVILTGASEDGVPAEQNAAAVLQTLGLSWWYTFSPGASPLRGTNQVLLARPTADPDPAALAARASAQPGSVWLLGNEPNVPGQDNLDPGAFATWYHNATLAIRSVDPTATLVGPNPLNFDFTCTACAGYTSGHDWSDQFLAAYRNAYHEDPPIDVWGAHVYDVDWAHPPLVHTQRSWDQLEATRTWLDADPALASKPIWLTEFGVIFGFDTYVGRQVDGQTLIAPGGPWREDMVGGYVRDMAGWLTTRGAELGIQRWFLYSALPAREPYQTDPAGVALLGGPSTALALTPEGQAYVGTAVQAGQTPASD